MHITLIIRQAGKGGKHILQPLLTCLLSSAGILTHYSEVVSYVFGQTKPYPYMYYKAINICVCVGTCVYVCVSVCVYEYMYKCTNLCPILLC